jgi:hypothetical protein
MLKLPELHLLQIKSIVTCTAEKSNITGARKTQPFPGWHKWQMHPVKFKIFPPVLPNTGYQAGHHGTQLQVHQQTVKAVIIRIQPVTIAQHIHSFTHFIPPVSV